MLASLAYLYIEKQYERNIFDSLVAYLQNDLQQNSYPNASVKQDSLLAKSVHLVHQLGVDRLAIFSSNPVEGIKAGLFQPVSVDLMTSQGACGSHAYVLGRLLREMDFDVRFPQMTVKDQAAGHILLEVNTPHGWVVLDAVSDVYFKRSDNNLASFDDVKNNWTYYQQQVPSSYNMTYRYEGVRYTNWDKIPVVMPLIKNVMYWTVGKKKTDGYSLRSLVLNKYSFLFNIAAAFYLVIVLFTINMWVKARRRATRGNQPVAHTMVSAASVGSEV